MSDAAVGIALSVHAFATLAMTGLIWFVQVVHYPLFQRVGEESFVAYESEHTRRTTLIVAPLMLAELSTATVLLVASCAEDSVRQSLATTGIALLIAAWASTFFVQVPLHQRLIERYEMRDARRLVATNWVRTIAWTARGVVALLMLSGAASA
ncbi:MAG: hypothetical protein KF684_06485 [Phycisphaeraceae bacterium]|nr:hypothetical protein [Phycisphaeraceae bacterium]